MGEMPQNWPPEFARRALENLELVEQHGTNNVTQIVLTLYALVVVPLEKKQFLEVEDITRDEMTHEGWAVEGWCWHCERSDVKNSSGLHAFLRMLRNALAHGNLTFIGNGKDITSIKIQHKCSKNSISGNWTTHEARCMCRKILSLFEPATDSESFEGQLQEHTAKT